MADTPLCAHCRTRSIEPKWRPFCSERCQLLDLGRWVDGAYRIPVEAPGDANSKDDDEKKSEI